MAFIDVVRPGTATGLLQRLYDQAVARAGKVYNVLVVQSRQPKVLRASTTLYERVMHDRDQPLTRAQCEMIAVAVSRANACEY